MFKRDTSDTKAQSLINYPGTWDFDYLRPHRFEVVRSPCRLPHLSTESRRTPKSRKLKTSGMASKQHLRATKVAIT